MTDPQPDIPGMKHELLDRTYVVSDMFDRHVNELAERLREHYAISSDLFVQIVAISEALGSLYQNIGREL